MENNKQNDQQMKQFAVLQLSGCAGCEVSLLNADEWVSTYHLAYMPLVISAHDIPNVDVLLVSGSVRTNEDLYTLREAIRHAHQVVAVGTCAISGGVAHLGDRDEVRQFFLSQDERPDLPHLLPRSRPIDDIIPVDRYLPGCPPTPELFLATLCDVPTCKPAGSVCAECSRKKDKAIRPTGLVGSLKGKVQAELCLINQGYLCIGVSTRGGCKAICTRAGYPCVGCRGPSDAFIEKESKAWFEAIQRVFTTMTDVPAAEIEAGLHSPQLALFLFQFSDYQGQQRPLRPKDKFL